MCKIKLVFSIIILALLSSFNVNAATTTVTRIITTPAPEPKEVVVAPSGYQYCFTVGAGWYNDTWIPEHQVCQYANSTQGVVWVQGYWACDQKNENYDCTNWVWKSGRWVKTFEVY